MRMGFHKVVSYGISYKILVTPLLFLISLVAFGQLNEHKLRLKILESDKIGLEFVYKENSQSTTRLTYLGRISSKSGKQYKILNSIWIWGRSHRATSRILIFDYKNNYLGNYPLTLIDDLPTYIKGNKLVFINKYGTNPCDPRFVTKISFDDGIPSEFFRKCNDKDGDIYTFNKN